MVSTVHIVMIVLYVGTIVLMLGEGVVSKIRMRNAPTEILQLRMFGLLESMNRALILLGIGLVVGIVTVLPIMLEVNAPDVWYYVMSSLSAATAWYAILRIGAMFRVPGASRPPRAQEILQ